MAVTPAMNGMPHRAFLRELDRGERVEAAISRVRAGTTRCSQLLHQHHAEGEDTYLFLLVVQRSTGMKAGDSHDRRVLEAEHEQLQAALAACDDDFCRLRTFARGHRCGL
ncbi:MAG: hypothetical protein H6526_02450 [Actinobacteria bacterium]|nr:hypothetical protein [Actinomycetota bacterium]